MRRFGGWADPESYVVMKRKTCFFPGWVGCINILMVSQFYPHFPARLRLHRGACPQSMREWLCCPHAGCNILDRYKVVPVDHKSLSKPVLFLVPSPTVNFCESMEVLKFWLCKYANMPHPSCQSPRYAKCKRWPATFTSYPAIGAVSRKYYQVGATSRINSVVAALAPCVISEHYSQAAPRTQLSGTHAKQAHAWYSSTKFSTKFSTRVRYIHAARMHARAQVVILVC
jgi:hypothetical protein